MKFSRQEIKIYASVIFGNLGSRLLSFIIGLAILKHSESAMTFGFSQVIGPLVGVITLPFIAGFIDKYNKKKIMYIGQVVSMLSLVLYMVLNHYYKDRLLINTYFLLVGLSLADQFLYNSFQASVVNLVEDRRVQRVKSVQQVISAAIMVISPIAGAFLYALFPLNVFVVAEIFFEFAALAVLYKIDFNYVKSNIKNRISGDDNIVKLSIDGFKYIAKYKKLIFGLVFAMLLNFVLGGYIVGLPVLQIKILKFSDELYGLSQGLFAVGLIASGLALTLYHVKKLIIIVRNAAFALGLVHVFLGVILLLLKSKLGLFASIAIFNIVAGSCISACNILLSTWATKYLPEDLQGRIFSTLSSGSQLLLPVGIMFYSFILDYIHPGAVILANGVAIALVIIFVPKRLHLDVHNDDLN